MDRANAIQEVKRHFGDYLTPAKSLIGGKPSYVCPHCENGTGHDGTGIQPDPNSGDALRLHCFKCGWSGDVIDAYRLKTGTDFNTALTELCDLYGIELDGEAVRGDLRPARPQTRPTTQSGEKRPENRPTARDYGQYIDGCAQRIGDPQAIAYLQARGISLETATAYGVGYDPTGYLVIPASRHYYTARATDPATRPRFKNPTGAKIEFFNMAAIYGDDPRPVFVTEAAIDALSIIEAGGVAVGLNSASNAGKFAEALKAHRPRKVLIIALDDDEAGHKAASKLKDALDALNVSCVPMTPYGGKKDANEALTTDRAAFERAISEAQGKATRPDNMAAYIGGAMVDDMEALQKQAGRKTGFSNLDREAGAIYNGLYVVGGISSVGKTSFITQLCDQMAEAGQHVLFFSMEQSRLEIASKSIARRTARRDREHASTGLQVRMGELTTLMLEEINAYASEVGERVNVIEGNFFCTASYIHDYTRRYIEANDVRPVVIVDYLQILQPDVDPDTGRKITDARLSVDYSVTTLKRMSRKLEVPVFVVSSVNRSNYLTPIDFESFKESGGIEYTADVVWGLQLAAVNDDLFKGDDKKKVERRERLAQAKEDIPRDIELVCLKNRYGRSRYNARFVYYPQYDYFMPAR